MPFAKKHKTLFYVPGMISLVLIPVLCLWYFYAQKSFETSVGMELGLPDKGSDAKMLDEYLSVTQRNYREFDFNGSLKTDEANLVLFQKLLKHQNNIKDTINGIKLNFGKRMNYEVFIRILDILTIEETPTYIPYSNQMFIVNASASEIERERKKFDAQFGEYTQMNCGTQDYMERQNAIATENQRLLDSENSQKLFFKRHWYLFVVLFGMALINFYVLIKFNRNRIYNQKSYI